MNCVDLRDVGPAEPSELHSDAHIRQSVRSVLLRAFNMVKLRLVNGYVVIWKTVVYRIEFGRRGEQVTVG